jgi:exopolysaccharide biosynthesis polyprenyl glycosylphosphotransferase
VTSEGSQSSVSADDAPFGNDRPSGFASRVTRSTEPGQRHPPSYSRRRLLAASDALVIVLAVLASFLAIGGARLNDSVLGLATVPVWILLFKLYGLYDADAKRISHSTVDDIPQLFHALVIGGLLLWSAYRVFTAYNFFSSEILSFGVLAFCGVLGGRVVVRHLASRLTRPERLLIVGSGPTSRLLIHKIAAHREYRLDPVGYLDEAGEEDKLAGVLPHFGHVSDLTVVCATHSVDRIVMDAASLTPDTITDVVRFAKDIDPRLSLVPQMCDVLGPAVELDHIEGLAILAVNSPVLTRSSRFLKRAMDLFVAALLMLVALPLILVAALVIKLTSRGPIFYVQQRLGRNGQPFGMLKLRTMVADAEDRGKELASLSSHPVWLLLDQDPRVTRAGRVLRRMSVDELPQLWNVIRGQMSLVGPRPMPADIYAHIADWGHKRLDLTPGITGLWQVLGRTSIPFEEMVKLDYLYVTNWSLWEDMRLLLRTLPVVLARRGAN